MDYKRIVTTAAGLVALVGATHAQTLYSGNAAAAGVTFRSWGGGSAAESDELGKTEPKAIRVTSNNFYQGGLIRFSRPVSFGSAFGNKDNLLKLMVRFPDGGNATRVAAPGAGAGAGARGGTDDGDGGGDSRGGTGGGGQGAPPGVPPGFFGGQGGPAGARGARGGAPTAATARVRSAAASKIRMIVGTSDGKKSEAYLDLSSAQAAATSWFAAAVPLQAIQGFDKTNKEVVSILVSADVPTTLFVKDIVVSRDESPIYADLNVKEELNLAFGDEYTFVGNGFGGATKLKYEWNFDSERSEGVDAEGQTVKRRFRKAGTFLLKMTVSDIYGLKKPFTRTLKITVNP